MRAAVEGIGTVAVELEPGSTAYVDAAWIPRDGVPVPALVVGSDGVLTRSWSQGEDGSVSGDHVEVVAAALRGLARDGVAALKGVEPDRVEVAGTGLVAWEARRLLGPDGDGSDLPLGILETTGDPDVVALAFERVADLGTVVLAGPLGARELDLDLYPDIHRRSLTVVGLSPRLPHGDDGLPAGLGAPPPATVRSGEHFPSDALWYRILPAEEAL